MALETVVLVPALEASPLVGKFRLRHDPSALAGIPPHITLLYPFVKPSSLTEETLSQIDHMLGGVKAFQYSLSAIREFEQGVLYLAPEPPDPFIQLTSRLSEQFGILPFEGAYPKVIPHLTVVHTASAADRRQIANYLRPGLPLQARASEAWLMVGNNTTSWKTQQVTKFRL